MLWRKYTKDSGVEYSARIGPVAFWINDDEGDFDTVIHYGHHTETAVLASLDAAKTHCKDRAVALLRESLATVQALGNGPKGNIMKCDYCLGFAEMEGDPDFCECHQMAQVKKSFTVIVKAVGAVTDWGMGPGVIGAQEFSLYADSEKEAASDIFQLAVFDQAEELVKNFVEFEIIEVPHNEIYQK